MTANKGQVEAFVFTVVLLVIAVAVIIGGIVALVSVRGSAISRAVAVTEGTSRPINFASGLLLLDAAANTSILEQALQIATTAKIPSPYGRSDLLPLSRNVYDAIAGTKLETNWRFLIANSTASNAVTTFELGTFPTFCGEFPAPQDYTNPSNKLAWCEDATSRTSWVIDDREYTSRCSPGRQECSGSGCHPDKCRQSQQCCRVVGYNWTQTMRRYEYSVTDGGEPVHPCPPVGSQFGDGWHGLCKYSCAPGEVEITDASPTCPGRSLGFLEKNQICCKPITPSNAMDASGLDAIVIPLLYASPTRKMAGKIEIRVGAPQ